MIDRARFLWNRLKERLWVRPLLMCLLSIFGAFVAKGIESTPIASHMPDVSAASIETLLTVLSGSMLVIAIFAVGSMITSYASASSSATPRTFPLVVSDDVSQNALSIFIGAFIYSLVSIVFFQNGFYRPAGECALLGLTILVFAIVILTFVRWVDRIARLGRLSETIDKAEEATSRALKRARLAPTLGCCPTRTEPVNGHAVFGRSIGYVQRINVESLQQCAEESAVRIIIAARPGTFAAPNRVLAHIVAEDGKIGDVDSDRIARAFIIGDRRTFDEDPRFGLVVLSEIAGRALSPAVNDPGTAIDIIGTMVRLLAAWAEPVEADALRACTCDRLEVSEVSVMDLFDDAFTAIARDGAGLVEVAARLQKALRALSTVDNAQVREAAHRHSVLALARAKAAMTLPEDVAAIQALAAFSKANEN